MYKKLVDVDGNPIRTAKLLLVSVIPMEDLSLGHDFLRYDTDDLYTISFSEFYLLLIFLRPDGEIFTTVRPRHTGGPQNYNKEQYYRSLIGQDFEVVING